MTFNMLILPFIYTGIASSVQLDDLESLYPIIIISLGIVFISYIVTVCIGIIPCFSMQKEKYFIPLCVASTFPNIVAFPIIIFPTLCEFEVVLDLVKEDIDIEDMDGRSLIDVCQKQTNAVVFTYFFGFNLLLWSIGSRTLINLDKVTNARDTETTTGQQSHIIQRGFIALRYYILYIYDVFIEVLKSPGFVALILGFITVCIVPLQKALFETGGYLRVAGSALESLSSTAATFITIVVAASLVEIKENQCDTSENKGTEAEKEEDVKVHDESNEAKDEGLRQSGLGLGLKASPRGGTSVVNGGSILEDEKNKGNQSYNLENAEGQTDVIEDDHISDNTNHTQKEKVKTRDTIVARCFDWFHSIPRETMKIYIWQILARLFVTPGIVFFILVKLDCAGLLDSIPNIAKLVLLINSAVPGALVVVVILKAHGFTDEAAVVSKTYLPTYILSVLTLSMWSTFGLMAFRQDSGIC